MRSEGIGLSEKNSLEEQDSQIPSVVRTRNLDIRLRCNSGAC